MKLPHWVGKNIVIGVMIEAAAMLLYFPVTNYLYYGGGWPFVQVFFLIIYGIGSRYIFKSQAPSSLKMLLIFWWVIYVVFGLIVTFLS